MGQVSEFLRKGDYGHSHWCPACEEMHILPLGWAFNGNVDKPTFTPSFKHSGKKTEKVNGQWTGKWILGPDGKALDEICHYVLTDGILNFCGDCTHSMKDQKVPLPKLPGYLTDA